MIAGHAGARVLKELGIDFVSGVAGESFLPLLEGMRLEGIPFLPTAHEAGAVYLAVGKARATGSPGVAAVTRGPGASNSLIGLYEAEKSATPLVLIVGQIDTSLRYRDGIQEMEIVETFRPTVKEAIEVTRPDRFAPALLAAFRKSLAGRPGPVVLSVPSDHLTGDAPAPIVPDAVRKGQTSRSCLQDEDLGQIHEALETSQRALLVLGPAFSGHRQASLAAKTAEAGGLGLLGAHSCLDVVHHESSSWLGCSTVRASQIIGEAFSQADTIVAFGAHFGDQTSQGYRETGARLINISIQDMAVWDEYFDAEHYVAEPVAALEQLQQVLRPGDPASGARAEWVQGLRESLARQRAQIYSVDRDGGTEGVPMSAVVEAVDSTLPASSRVVSDVGTFNDWFTRYLPFNSGRRYIGPTSNPMGCALPTAIGAHHSSPVDRTVVMVGDGGFLMSAMELSTLARLGHPVTVLVFVNGVWGSIARDQDRAYGTRYGTELGVVPDAALLAQSFGIEGRTIDEPSGLEEHLEWAFNHDGPSLIEIRTDPRRLSPADLEQMVTP